MPTPQAQCARSDGPSGPVPFDVDELISDRGIGVIVCCGSGGVGKTTTAAALALRASESGRCVVVLTIDPARRLAQSLGLRELDDTPRPVAGAGRDGGSLDAMMLDMKRTFDEVVAAHAPPERAAQIFANPFYQSLSSSFAGTQEYMAMEKLGQLREARRDDGGARWDLVVVDTPPSRSALDFLDAPRRLGSFLDGRLVRLLTSPARAGGRAYLKAVSGGVTMAAGLLTKLLGSTMLHDLQTLVEALDTTFGGFRRRADETYALLKHGGTAFVVVATPERDALREAGYFVERLRADDMPLAGVVVNRVALPRATGVGADDADRAAAELEHTDTSTDAGTTSTTAGVLRLHAVLARTAQRHEAMTEHFAATHPGVALCRVRARDEDVHDLVGLRDIGEQLASRP